MQLISLLVFPLLIDFATARPPVTRLSPIIIKLLTSATSTTTVTSYWGYPLTNVTRWPFPESTSTTVSTETRRIRTSVRIFVPPTSSAALNPTSTAEPIGVDLREAKPTPSIPAGRRFKLRLGDVPGQPPWLSNIILWKQKLSPERYSHDKNGTISRVGAAYVGKTGIKDFYSAPQDTAFEPFLGVWQDHGAPDGTEIPDEASYARIHILKDDGSLEFGDVNEMFLTRSNGDYVGYHRPPYNVRLGAMDGYQHHYDHPSIHPKPKPWIHYNDRNIKKPHYAWNVTSYFFHDTNVSDWKTPAPFGDVLSGHFGYIQKSGNKDPYVLGHWVKDVPHGHKPFEYHLNGLLTTRPRPKPKADHRILYLFQDANDESKAESLPSSLLDLGTLSLPEALDLVRNATIVDELIRAAADSERPRVKALPVTEKRPCFGFEISPSGPSDAARSSSASYDLHYGKRYKMCDTSSNGYGSSVPSSELSDTVLVIQNKAINDTFQKLGLSTVWSICKITDSLDPYAFELYFGPSPPVTNHTWMWHKNNETYPICSNTTIEIEFLDDHPEHVPFTRKWQSAAPKQDEIARYRKPRAKQWSPPPVRKVWQPITMIDGHGNVIRTTIQRDPFVAAYFPAVASEIYQKQPLNLDRHWYENLTLPLAKFRIPGYTKPVESISITVPFTLDTESPVTTSVSKRAKKRKTRFPVATAIVTATAVEHTTTTYAPTETVTAPPSILKAREINKVHVVRTEIVTAMVHPSENTALERRDPARKPIDRLTEITINGRVTTEIHTQKYASPSPWSLERMGGSGYRRRDDGDGVWVTVSSKSSPNPWSNEWMGGPVHRCRDDDDGVWRGVPSKSYQGFLKETQHRTSTGADGHLSVDILTREKDPSIWSQDAIGQVPSGGFGNRRCDDGGVWIRVPSKSYWDYLNETQHRTSTINGRVTTEIHTQQISYAPPSMWSVETQRAGGLRPNE